jgi:hypothetical protein
MSMQRRTAQVSFDLSQLQHQYFRLASVCDAVMHIALRSPRDKQFFVDGENVVPDVYYVLDKVGTLYSFSRQTFGVGLQFGCICRSRLFPRRCGLASGVVRPAKLSQRWWLSALAAPVSDGCRM